MRNTEFEVSEVEWRQGQQINGGKSSLINLGETLDLDAELVLHHLILRQAHKKLKYLTLHLKKLEKEEMKNPRVSRRKEIIKIRVEINEKETKETAAKINKAKSWFFEKINKIDKSLARLIKKRRGRNQMNKIRNENGEITSDNTEIERIIRNYY